MTGIKKKRISVATQNEGYLFIAPYYIFIFLFILLPIFANLFLSFTRYDLLTMKYIGLKNYFVIFTDELFLVSFKNTMIYTAFTLAGTMAGGFFTAVMLKEKIYGLKTFRTIAYLPHVMSMVAVSMIWMWMYEPNYGLINRLLGLVGFTGRQWLYNVDTALGSIIVMSIWKALGYNMVIYLAGLQSIPDYLYEAAKIDGANAYHKFINITLPMLAPITFFLFVTGFINNFRVFEQVNVLTEGGPMNATTTIMHQIYSRGFKEFRLGYAGALSILLLIVTLFVTLLNFKYGKQGKELDIG